MSEPNAVDWLTLFAAGTSTILSTITTVWVASRADREKFALHVDWVWEGSGPMPEYPVLYVQNRSAHTILIAEIAFYRGIFFRRRSTQTAKWFEDPADLNFPYEVQAGQTGKFVLDEDTAVKQYGKLANAQRRIARFRRGGLWIGVTTVAGKRRFVAAEAVLPWKERPEWLRASND